MNPYDQSRKLPFSNPLANALVVFVGALAIGASILLGFVAFLALGSLLLVLAAIVGIRLWWFNRKLRRQGHADPHSPNVEPTVRVEVIEGEFRVVPTPEQRDNGSET